MQISCTIFYLSQKLLNAQKGSNRLGFQNQKENKQKNNTIFRTDRYKTDKCVKIKHQEEYKFIKRTQLLINV
jgi:hypothetical protein